jgi:hypothetical protein
MKTKKAMKTAMKQMSNDCQKLSGSLMEDMGMMNGMQASTKKTDRTLAAGKKAKKLKKSSY